MSAEPTAADVAEELAWVAARVAAAIAAAREEGRREADDRIYRCCVHCQDDAIHDVINNEHDLPCDICTRDDELIAARKEADDLRQRVEALADEIEADARGWGIEPPRIVGRLRAAVAPAQPAEGTR